jgi:hypothetical protein
MYDNLKIMLNYLVLQSAHNECVCSWSGSNYSIVMLYAHIAYAGLVQQEVL